LGFAIRIYFGLNEIFIYLFIVTEIYLFSSETKHASLKDKDLRFSWLSNPIELQVPYLTGMCNMTEIIQSIKNTFFV